MIVRIRLKSGPTVQKTRGKNRNVALGAAALLTPLTLSCYVLGFWRLGSDLRFFADFAISTGLYSHWQVWLALAAILHLTTYSLERYGRGFELRFPTAIFVWLTSFGRVPSR
jgi:hypothetical protein